MVEIGFGNGAFLIDLARRNPSANLVGIDRSWESVRRLCRRLDGIRLRNIRVVHADATVAIGQLFDPNTINRVFVNFPDPWSQQRHHGRRLIRPEFVAELTGRLAPRGEVTIATDHSDYASWIAGVLEGQTALRSKLDSTWVQELEGRSATKYERRGKTTGAQIYYFLWRREGGLSAAGRARGSASVLAATLLVGPNLERLLRDFKPPSWQASHLGVAVVGKVLGVYRHMDSGHQLVEMQVQEGELTQHLGLLVQMKAGGEVQITLAPLGCPQPSWGVKQAARRVAKALEKRARRLRLAGGGSPHR